MLRPRGLLFCRTVTWAIDTAWNWALHSAPTPRPGSEIWATLAWAKLQSLQPDNAIHGEGYPSVGQRELQGASPPLLLWSLKGEERGGLTVRRFGLLSPERTKCLSF